MRSLVSIFTSNNNSPSNPRQRQRPVSLLATRRLARDPSTAITAPDRQTPLQKQLQRSRSSRILPAATHSEAAAASTTATNTTTGPPATPLAARYGILPPSSLRISHRNQDAIPLTATTTTRSTAATAAIMPVGDRGRPAPQLSVAPSKPINRSPLTPKVATIAPQAITPLARRSHNPPATIANFQAPKDDVASPVPSYLSNNITPRSGSRQTRVESANTTPNGTPNPEKAVDLWDSGSGINSRGPLGSSALPYDAGRTSTSPGDMSSESSDVNKFFYASDAKSLQQVAQPRPASVPQKPTTFFYANGISAESKRTSTPPVTLANVQESAATKFFYANGTPDLLPRPGLPVSGPASSVSSTSRMVPLRPATSSSVTGASFPQRPVSPIKAVSSQSAYTLKTSSVPAPPTSPVRQQMSSPPTLAQAPLPRSKRRVSIDAPQKPVRGHSRTGSVPTVESLIVPRLSTGSTESVPSPPRSPGPSQSGMTMASILQAAEDIMEEEEARGGDSRSDTQSPSKSTRFRDPVSDLVANARRERKVQDLEITNASLEAINRTLERQLRKQTAELRRYRRLSRSGRLSLASAASSRVSSLALTEPHPSLSDLSEEEASEEEEEDEDDLDSLDDLDSSGTEADSIANALSPDTRLFTRRKRDERRLQLDLSKHQELLIDSQKMNQSLKRCLNWTEVLIKEGQKALEYNVRVSDVELGGRVLAPPDEDDEGETSHLGDDTLTGVEAGLEPPWAKGPQDRDSGIDLPPDGG